MKICFAVCEYNPFHNGHLRHIERIKEEIKPDATVIIMSGNFTQRGEIAVTDKFTRATHAIKAGADMVVELPAAFAVSPAEIFAKGAVKLINSVKAEKKVLCFGMENPDKTKLIATAKALLNETKEFKALLKEELKTGVSYIKAKVNALEKMNIENVDFDLLKSPNNILAIEYAKAIVSSGADVELFPIKREGADFNDDKLSSKYPSALAIRTAIKEGKLKSVKKCVPKFVYEDLPSALPSADELILYRAFACEKSYLRKVCDCSEGLENRIKAFSKTSGTLEELKDKLKTKRYTYARISRILLANFLEIDEGLIKRSLRGKLYLKVLALNPENDKILPYMSINADFPIIMRRGDIEKLTGAGEECYQKDEYANDLYKLIANKR
ncbi:MAG: nucleotidyltransferase family protein [Clostridia bacterium]|nr:nucleotidyltransferase family protein [Clostridia bacterium]